MKMDSQENNIKNTFDNAERIGVIGSPSSSHNLTIDIMGTAVDKKLVGSLCMFNFKQDGADHFALGQITEINLRNIWSEDPTMRGLIRQKGRVDPITERQDTHTASMLVSSVFGKNQRSYQPSMLGTVPSTGTPIRLMNEQFMRDLLSDFSREIVYLGKAYGSSVLLPMWFKHFGKGEGGIEEAYHIGIFGKTGSGKSVLSKMVMTAYARHNPMTIFVLDPQGEFAKIKADDKMQDSLEKLGKKPKIYGLHNLVLSGNHLFRKILILSGFLDELGIVHEDNKARAANQIDMMLQGRHPFVGAKGAIPPWDFNKREVFNLIWEALKTDQVLIRIYSTKDLMERVRSALQAADEEYMFKLWKSVALLFTYKQGTESIEIKKLTKSVIQAANGQIIIIDLSDLNVPADTLWNDRIRMIVINEFLQSLSNEAQLTYKEGNSLNTLVVIDEAHRLAPRESQNNVELETIKTTLKDAVRTTRKFGLGWMFISQTLSGLDREIINQLRIYIFGFGLAYGIELQGLREIIGGNDEAIRLYQLFKDPQSNPHQKEYSFMTIGPISPLSFSGIPLFFQALSYPDFFIKDNISTFSGSTM
jgi:hypothetical protein